MLNSYKIFVQLLTVYLIQAAVTSQLRGENLDGVPVSSITEISGRENPTTMSSDSSTITAITSTNPNRDTDVNYFPDISTESSTFRTTNYSSATNQTAQTSLSTDAVFTSTNKVPTVSTESSIYSTNSSTLTTNKTSTNDSSPNVNTSDNKNTHVLNSTSYDNPQLDTYIYKNSFKPNSKNDDDKNTLPIELNMDEEDFLPDREQFSEYSDKDDLQTASTHWHKRLRHLYPFGYIPISPYYSYYSPYGYNGAFYGRPSGFGAYGYPGYGYPVGYGGYYGGYGYYNGGYGYGYGYF